MNISISIPGDGSALRGQVPVSVDARPSKNLSQIELFVDGSLLAADSAEPYEFSWDTTAIPDGKHSLLARAHYKQRISEAELTVWVANSAPEPEPPPPPPPPPDGVAYPASYFTGPLGQKNPLPTQAGAFLLTWANKPGGSFADHKALILQREADMGRKYDGIMFPDMSSSEIAENRMQWIHDHGSIPIAAGLHFNPLNVTQIAAGQADAQIDAVANRYAALGFTIIVRLFHEFDQPTAYSSVGREADFRAAWRRVVDRFKAQGAANVGFWWCPGNGGGRKEVGDPLTSWPGDEYVDWSGADGYNWVLHGEDKYATPYEPGWVSFAKVFDYEPGFANLKTEHDIWGPRKPFMIGETGTTFDPSFPLTKGEWYREVPAAAKNMEYLRGVSWFDVDASSESAGDVYPQRNNWVVNYPTSQPSAYQGFIAMARDPWFNTRG